MTKVALAFLVACLAALLSAVPALAVAPPDLAVTGASLVVGGTNQPLWSESGEREVAIASTTKLMTALIVLQHVNNLNQVFTQGNWHDQPGDSQVGLVPGEKMTVHDLLIATLVPSADDAAWDLAYNVGGGSTRRFVAMMNAEARKLGLTHTHYTTPTGLDTPGNYSSADDLVRLADYDMRHWAFLSYAVGLRSAQIMVGDDPLTVTSTDTLLGAVPWIHGIKTGHTDEAGYVLVSTGTRDGLTLIDAVLGTASEADRNANALALLDYGFAQFHLVKPIRRGEVMGHLPVDYSSQPATIIAKASFTPVVARSARVRVRTTFVHTQLSGPLAKGAVVGHALVLVGGKLADDVPLVVKHSLPAVSEMTKLGNYLRRPFTLVLLAVVIGAGVVVVSRRRPPRMMAAGQVDER